MRPPEPRAAACISLGIAIVVPSYDRRRAKYNAQAAELRKEYEAKKAALDAKSSNKKQKVGKDAAVEGDEGDDDDDDDDDEEEEEEDDDDDEEGAADEGAGEGDAGKEDAAKQDAEE